MGTEKRNVDFVFLKQFLCSNSYFFDFQKKFVSFNIPKMVISLIKDKHSKTGKLVLFGTTIFKKVEHAIPDDFVNFSSCKNPHKKTIDFFVKVVKDNPAILFESKISHITQKILNMNNCSESFIENIEKEIWDFKQSSSKTHARFFVSNVSVECSKMNSVQYSFLLNGNFEIISFYDCEHATKERIIESFLFGVKHCLSAKSAIDHLKNSVCTRDEKWIANHGM
jgi:hypothetical protein